MAQPYTNTSKNYFIYNKYIKNLINKENIHFFILKIINNYYTLWLLKLTSDLELYFLSL